MDIGPNTKRFVFCCFLKRKKLTNTGFFLWFFVDLGLSNLLDGLVFFGYWMICSINQLLTQKYVEHVVCTIADLLFFNFMVITHKQVNYLEI